MRRFGMIAAVALVVLTLGAAFAAAGDEEKLFGELTNPACPHVTDDAGVVWLIRGVDLPKDVQKGDRLQLKGHEMVTRPQLQDESCNLFDKVFDATDIKVMGPKG